MFYISKKYYIMHTEITLDCSLKHGIVCFYRFVYNLNVRTLDFISVICNCIYV